MYLSVPEFAHQIGWTWIGDWRDLPAAEPRDSDGYDALW